MFRIFPRFNISRILIFTFLLPSTLVIGQTWTIYNKLNSGLVGNTVDAIAIDAQGNKWFGASGSGVSKFDGINWTTYTTSNSGLAGNTVWSIAIDAQGNKWFGTLYAGVSQLTEKSTNIGNISLPFISLGNTTVNIAQSLTIKGENFSPNGKVYLQFYGAAGYVRDSTIADIYGKYTFNYRPTLINAQSGQAAVKAFDVITGVYTSPRGFEITSSTSNSQQQILGIVLPTEGGIYTVGTNVNIAWKDKMYFDYNGITYPRIPNQARRVYQYKLEWKTSASATWTAIRTVSGDAMLATTQLFREGFTPPTAGTYQVRVKDDIANVTVTSGNFTVAESANNLLVEKRWDYSLNRPNSEPLGIAADGTARMYLVVSKRTATGATISSVKATINGNTTIKDGKIRAATTINGFSNEANGTTTLTATNSTASNGSFWFWYIAPDDFQSSGTDKTSRKVTVKFETTYSDGTTGQVETQIEVVRPPLMLVHGLGGDRYTFANFQNKNNVLVEGDNRLILSRAVEMYPNASFERNAKALLNDQPRHPTYSFEGVLFDMRKLGYVSNRVDYVGHSMGGNIARYAAERLPQLFFNNKNYGSGFINKFITLNTPHDGSPIADMIKGTTEKISEYVNDKKYNQVASFFFDFGKLYLENPNSSLFTFIKPRINNNSKDITNVYQLLSALNLNNNTPPLVYDFVASPACEDLKIDGGVRYAITNLKTHLIAGDIVKGYQNWPPLQDLILPNDIKGVVNELFGDNTTDYIDIFADYWRQWAKDEKVRRKFKVLSQIPDEVERKVNFFNTLIGIYNSTIRRASAAGFFIDSDGIVPLTSQTASLNGNTSNTSVFQNLHANPPISNLGNWSVTSSKEVVEKVWQLLDAPIISPNFGSIPASLRRQGGSILAINSFFDSLRLDKITTVVDSTKIKILNPKNSVVKLDSTMKIQVNVRDTAKLLYLELVFQNKHYRKYAINQNMTFNIQATQAVIDTQFVYVRGYYDLGDNAKIVYDGIRLVVQASNPLALSVSPKIVYLAKNQEHQPTYKVRFQRNTTEFAQNPKIAAGINAPSLLSFNKQTSTFTALNKGETFAIVDYKGTLDTVYFVISDSSSIRTGTTELIPTDMDKNAINFQIFPNPFQDMTTIQYELPSKSRVSINVVNSIGQTVKTIENSTQNAGKYQKQIPLTMLPSGLYLLIVKTDFGEFTSKLLKN